MTKRNTNENSKSDDHGFRLGIFGGNYSGKTTYFTMLKWFVDNKPLPKGISQLMPSGSSANYLDEKIHQIESGKWPQASTDKKHLEFILTVQKHSFLIQTHDFKGGDFFDAVCPSDKLSPSLQEFVDDLTENWDAYIFLIDTEAVLKAKGELEINEQDDSEDINKNTKTVGQRNISALAAALAEFWKKRKSFKSLHRPTAIVFTKCDVYPRFFQEEALIDFAEKHLQSVCLYLKKHCKRHKFFSISSTGGAITLENGKSRPVERKKLLPMNITSPIQWCAEQHIEKKRFLNKLWGAIATVIVVCVVLGIYFNNDYEIRSLQSKIENANEEEIYQLYKEAAKIKNSPLYLTHNDVRKKVYQNIINSAEKWLMLQIKTGNNQNILSARDWVNAEKQIKKFVGKYPGSENSTRLQQWLKNQKEQLSLQIKSELKKLAEDGNRKNFEIFLEEYKLVQVEKHDLELEEIQYLLNRKTIANRLRQSIWYARQSPQNIKKVRSACSEAETKLKKYPIRPADKEYQYIKLSRKVYDRLKQIGLLISVNLKKIQSENNRQIKWILWSDDIEVWTSSWVEPAQEKEKYRVMCGMGAHLNHFERNKGIKVEIKLDSSGSKNSKTLYIEDFAKNNSFNMLIDNKNYKLVFEQIPNEHKEVIEQLTKLRKLEDELFRKTQ